MTQTATTWPQMQTLRNRLEDAATYRRLFIRLARLLTAVSLWLAVTLSMIVADAVWPMPPVLRLVAVIALLAALVMTVLQWRLPAGERLRKHRFEAWRLEQWLGLKKNPMVNPVSMSTDGLEEDELRRELVRRSLQRGDETAKGIAYTQATDRRPAWRRLGLLGVVLMMWLAIFALQPRMMPGGFWRFASPWGDHPPFSRTTFEVEFAPKPVTNGDDVTKVARDGSASHRLIRGIRSQKKTIPRKAAVVLVKKAERRTRRCVMQPMN